MSNEESPPAPIQPTWRIPKWFPDLEIAVQRNLKIYWEDLIKFNKTVNLISPKTIAHADSVHFGDSINAANIVYRNNSNINNIADLGSGNGFPGLVFGIMFPGVSVTLMDVDQRKCEFLKHVISRVGAKNLKVSNVNIDQLGPDSLTFAISRGFASIPKTMMTLRSSLSMGGAIYFLKSDEWSLEVSQIPTQLCSIWSPSLIGDYSPPDSSAKYYVVKADKIA
jgi:16S rRNA (guanine527-N7)-methyltransferase